MMLNDSSFLLCPSVNEFPVLKADAIKYVMTFRSQVSTFLSITLYAFHYTSVPSLGVIGLASVWSSSSLKSSCWRLFLSWWPTCRQRASFSTPMQHIHSRDSSPWEEPTTPLCEFFQYKTWEWSCAEFWPFYLFIFWTDRIFQHYSCWNGTIHRTVTQQSVQSFSNPWLIWERVHNER